MKKKFWTSDKLIAITAMFVSVLTLIIFVRQTNLIEEQSHLSVMPYLMLETSQNNARSTYAIDLHNYGVGPAVIEDSYIVYNNMRHEVGLDIFLRENFVVMDSVETINYSSIQNGVAIPAESKRNLITIGGGEKSYLTFLKVLDSLSRTQFKYEIKYKSIYNDRWSINSINEMPVKEE